MNWSLTTTKRGRPRLADLHQVYEWVREFTAEGAEWRHVIVREIHKKYLPDSSKSAIDRYVREMLKYHEDEFALFRATSKKGGNRFKIMLRK